MVSVHDPLTGLPSLPVAVVGWRNGWSYWDWIPMRPAAGELRYGLIDSLDGVQRQQWLSRYYEHPTMAYSVDQVEEVLAAETCDDEALERKVHDVLDELLVEGL